MSLARILFTCTYMAITISRHVPFSHILNPALTVTVTSAIRIIALCHVVAASVAVK